LDEGCAGDFVGVIFSVLDCFTDQAKICSTRTNVGF